MQKLMVVLEKY